MPCEGMSFHPKINSLKQDPVQKFNLICYMERIKHSRALLHPVSSEPDLPLYGLYTGLPARPFYQAARNAEPKTRHCTKVVYT